MAIDLKKLRAGAVLRCRSWPFGRALDRKEMPGCEVKLIDFSQPGYGLGRVWTCERVGKIPPMGAWLVVAISEGVLSKHFVEVTDGDKAKPGRSKPQGGKAAKAKKKAAKKGGNVRGRKR